MFFVAPRTCLFRMTGFNHRLLDRNGEMCYNKAITEM
jgi:hypothetical protein